MQYPSDSLAHTPAAASLSSPVSSACASTPATIPVPVPVMASCDHDAPVLVETVRGSLVENCHRGIAAIVDCRGWVIGQWGNIEQLVYPRSAIAALQAIPLVETGALDAFQLGETELALACASHSGELRHIRLARNWLNRIGLGAEALGCGASWPLDQDTMFEMIRSHESTTPLHNPCSGKHVGLLTTALHTKETIQGYLHPDHPVQKRLRIVLEEMTSQDLSQAPVGMASCQMPALAMPLRSVALAMARLGQPEGLPEPRLTALSRIRKAWATHHPLISGHSTFDTRLMRAVPGAQLLIKRGSDGMCCAILPRQRLGIAVKIVDGSDAAAMVAMAALLRSCKVIPEKRWIDLADLATPPLLSQGKRLTGYLRPAPDWLT